MVMKVLVPTLPHRRSSSTESNKNKGVIYESERFICVCLVLHKQRVFGLKLLTWGMRIVKQEITSCYPLMASLFVHPAAASLSIH